MIYADYELRTVETCDVGCGSADVDFVDCVVEAADL